MPVVLTNPITAPAIIYDKVHMDSLIISQERTNKATAAFKMRMCLYYLDANGNKVFSELKEHTKDVGFEDAEAWIMSLQGVDQVEAFASMNSIKAMVATVTRLLSPWGAASVV